MGVDPGLWLPRGSHADTRLRADARGCDGGVREELAAGIRSWRPPAAITPSAYRAGGLPTGSGGGGGPYLTQVNAGAERTKVAGTSKEEETMIKILGLLVLIFLITVLARTKQEDKTAPFPAKG